MASNHDRVLVGTSGCLFLVDVMSGEKTVVDRGYGLYYGISWDHERLFVAARWYPWFMPTSHIERPRLLIFDAKLRLTECLEFPVSAGGLHQIVSHQGELYCSCSREDGFVVMAGDKFSTWYPSTDPRHHGTDVHHFNSIWINDDTIRIIGHNNGPSDVWELSYANKSLIRTIRIGKHVHNIWPYEDTLAVCNSSQGRIETIDGRILVETGGFPRGVALGPERNVIGISAKASRSNRFLTRGALHVYSKDWELIREINLGHCGGVCEVRNIDLPDAAHNGLEAPLEL